MNKKSLWKAQLLEFLHQYFIGISNLTCSESICPLVENWQALETKQSKKGKSALYLISHRDKKWITADLISYEENDLGEFDCVEIQLKSGKTWRMKPYNYVPLKDINGKEIREIFLKPSEVVVFFNNSTKRPNLEEAEEIYLEDLWDIKEKIKWDREKSKKKVFLFCENDPSDETQSRKIDASEKDYLFPIADFSTTNEIKDYEVYSPSKGPEERKQLHEDYQKDFSELRRVYGIRHLTSKKEDRQNNPEIELNEAQFVALERDKWRERMKSIKDFEQKGGCEGKHTLSYGSYQEHTEQLQLEEAVAEADPVQNLENQWHEYETKKEKGSDDEPKEKK